MSDTIKMLSNFEYKSLFLPGLSEKIYFNNSKLQLYRIENYLRNILIPVLPYRTTFNFIIFVTNGRIKQQLEISEYEIVRAPCFWSNKEALPARSKFRKILKGFLSYLKTSCWKTYSSTKAPTTISLKHRPTPCCPSRPRTGCRICSGCSNWNSAPTTALRSAGCY